MSRAGRAFGIARSLLVYHAIPLRQRRMQRLYRQFVRPGDLVFDIGAHVGNRVRAFAAIGCRVIALEPQPDFARLLRTLFGRSTRIEVVEAAVTGAAGAEWLSVSERNPTVSTTAASWREARAREPGFGGVQWNQRIRVRAVTTDALIAQYGVPAFIKIDVEGFEEEVLMGLTQPVAALSFEFTTIQRDVARACVSRCAALGMTLFSPAIGESQAIGEWRGAEAIGQWLDDLPHEANSGDIYALRP